VDGGVSQCTHRTSEAPGDHVPGRSSGGNHDNCDGSDEHAAGVVQRQVDAHCVGRQLDAVMVCREVLGCDGRSKNGSSFDAEQRILIDETFNHDRERNGEQGDGERGDGEDRDKDPPPHGSS